MRRKLSVFLVILMLCASFGAHSESSHMLNVMVYDRGVVMKSYGTVTENPWTQFLQQKAENELGIKVRYTAVSRSNDLDEMYLLLAGKNTPDIMFTYDTDVWLRLCENGQVADLTEEISLYGDRILKNQAAVLPYGQYQGKQYGICNQRSSVEVTSGFIREDWLDAVGIHPARHEDGYYLVTPDELLDILMAFQKAALAGSEDAPVFHSYGSTYWPILLILEAFYDQENISREDLYAKPFFLFEGAKEGYRCLNRLYNSGLMNEDFAFLGDNDKCQLIDAVVNGRAGFWINDSWFGFMDNTLTTLYENDPNARVAAIDIVNAQGKNAYKYAYSDAGLICFVPAKSTHKADAVRYLNMLSDQTVDFALRFGFEHEHYVMADGLPYPLEKEGATPRSNVTDLALMYNGATYMKDGVLNLQLLPENLRDLRRQAYRVATSNVFQIPAVADYVSVSSTLAETLDKKERELRFRSIMCPQAEFDAVWDEYVQAYLESGGQALIDEKIRVYRAGQAQ